MDHITILLLVLILLILVFGFRTLRVLKRIRAKAYHTEVLYEQIECLFAIYAAIQPRIPLPNMRIWAISPDFAKILLQILMTEKPRKIVDFGSGVSTILSAYSLEKLGEQNGKMGHIYSFDHEAEFVQRTQKLLHQHKVAEYVTLSHAPIQKLELEGNTWDFYHHNLIDQVHDIDLMIVDGPHGSHGILDRYPAIPLLISKLNSGGIILIDDTSNFKESPQLIAMWEKKYPELRREDFPTEKGTVVFKKL